ncbi:MAG: VOC family protein [Gammaproteobacteria bacterium]|nr:VOC family protein [Gammaproteobacteria bacterium]
MTGSVSTPHLPLRPVQLAYHVPDSREAAMECALTRGWGPFYLMERIPLEFARYRGHETTWVHTSAYGQAGDIMVELISQPDDVPSVLRERFTRDQRGLHHVASFVDDLPAAIELERQRGHQIALEARTTTGVDFAMIDTVPTLGHLLELYKPDNALKDFYTFVRRKAENWDGSHPVRLLR